MSEKETNEEIIDDIDLELEDTEIESLGAEDKVKKLREQLKEAKSQRDEYLTGWQKAKADYINFRNEQERLRKDMRNYVRQDCARDLLPALDAFDMAMKGEAWENVDKNWRVGVEYIQQQIMKMLEDYGVSPIEPTSGVFDPNLHSPMESREVEDESQHEQILELIQKGYQSGEVIIRPAKVVVGNYPQ